MEGPALECSELLLSWLCGRAVGVMGQAPPPYLALGDPKKRFLMFFLQNRRS